MISSFDVVVATDRRRGIGRAGQLPWKLSQDMKYFQSLTSKSQDPEHLNAIIMGRKTWESIPEKRRPLSGRINVILTRKSDYSAPQGVLVAASLDQAMEELQAFHPNQCFVIGGGEIYRQALEHPACRQLYLTQIDGEFGCDTFFPEYEKEFTLVSASDCQEENGVDYCFKVFLRSLS